MTSYQENELKRRPYTTMTLAYLASQFCTELGPAQPQLSDLFMANHFFVLGYGRANLTVPPPRREAVSPCNSFLYSVRGGMKIRLD